MSTSLHSDHAVLNYLGDWLRDVPFDYASTYEYPRKNATDPKGSRPYLQEYLDQGISEIVRITTLAHRTLSVRGRSENAGIQLRRLRPRSYAKKLGKEDDYQMFLKRARNYRNVFDSSLIYAGKDGGWQLGHAVRIEHSFTTSSCSRKRLGGQHCGSRHTTCTG